MTKSFEEKYNKKGNAFVNVQAQTITEHPLFKDRPVPVKVILQFVIMPDGKIAGRVVG